MNGPGRHHEVFARLDIGMIASSWTVLEVEGTLEDLADGDIAVVVVPARHQVRGDLRATEPVVVALERDPA